MCSCASAGPAPTTNRSKASQADAKRRLTRGAYEPRWLRASSARALPDRVRLCAGRLAGPLERLLQDVPGQDRALDPDRVLHDPLQGNEIAEMSRARASDATKTSISSGVLYT